MPFSKPAYPKTLTHADWQKKRGNIAKLAGPTGIGDALQEVQVAYDSVDWPVLDLFSTIAGHKNPTSKVIAFMFADAKREYDAMVDGVLNKKLKAVAKLASHTATQWKKKPLIPKSSVKALSNVLTASLEFGDRIANNKMLADITRDYNALLKAKVAEEDRLEKQVQKLAKFSGQIIKQARSIKTAEDFNGKFWSESIRGVSTALPQVASQLGLMDALKAWLKFAAETYRAKQDEEVPGKIREVATVLKDIAIVLNKYK